MAPMARGRRSTRELCYYVYLNRTGHSILEDVFATQIASPEQNDTGSLDYPSGITSTYPSHSPVWTGSGNDTNGSLNCSNYFVEMLANFSKPSDTSTETTPVSAGIPPFPGMSFIIPLYTLIFFLSFIGNFLVILTLVKNRRMRTVTNVLLLNLSISDLLLGVFCMPVTLIGQILRNFVFGELMCKAIPYAQAVSVSVGVWTLVAISLERYFAICRPLQSRKWQTRSHAYKMILAVWFFTLIWNIPIAFYSELQPMKASGRYKCREIWPTKGTEKTFNLILDFLLLLIPLCIMAMAYSLIVSKLHKGLKNEKRSFHQYGAHGISYRDESLELSTRSQYSNYKLGGTNETQSTMAAPASVRVCAGREGVTHEVVRGRSTRRKDFRLRCQWNRNLGIEVTDGHSGTGTQNGDHHLHPHNCNNLSCNGNQLKPQQSQRHGPKISRAIRSTYTGKSIEAKKKVISMLFVLVAEFFICWTPLHLLNTWYLFDSEAVYRRIGPMGVVLIQLLAYVSSCCNPITYCFLNRKFRQAFIKVFKCSPIKGKSGPPTIGRDSADISANGSLVYAVQGSNYIKSVANLGPSEHRV